jgi:hypothetical protein
MSRLPSRLARLEQTTVHDRRRYPVGQCPACAVRPVVRIDEPGPDYMPPRCEVCGAGLYIRMHIDRPSQDWRTDDCDN